MYSRAKANQETRMKLRLIVLAALFVLPGQMFAGTSCATPTVVPADGRIVDFDFVAQSGDNFYQFDVTQGHSYSIEVRQDYDDKQAVNDLQTELFAVGNATCAGALTPNAAAGSAVRDTVGVDPVLPANSFRVSTVAGSTGTMRVKVHNNNGSTGRYISVVVADTTQFSPLYTTFGGFNTFYRLFNTSGQPVSATLKLFNPAGAQIGSTTVTVAANASTPTIFTGPNGGGNIGLGVAGDNAGPATLTHDGPPGAILVDGFSGIFGATTSTIPIVFRPVREKH
jgi:hypothetical protein